MHRLGRLLAVTLALASAPAAAHAAAPPAVPGQVVVGFDRGTSGSTRERIRDAVDADVVRTVGGVQSQVLRVDGDPAAVAARLERRGAVAYAAPNYLGRVAAGPNDPKWFDTPADVSEAWDYPVGDTGVPVGIADTGVATHEDLPAFTGSTGDPNGHGTEVAGTLAATAGNGKGSAGVVRQADFRSYAPCTAAGACSDAAVAEAIDEAAGDGVKVLNLSVQTTGVPEWPATAAAITAHEDDLLVVTAAGNGTTAAGSGRDVDGPGQASYPCSTRKPDGTRPANLVCVAASRGTNDGLYAFSNFGPDSVDLAAPGTGMTTTAVGTQMMPVRYTTPSGTSIAAPFVTGVAALAFARKPGASPADVAEALRNGVDPVPVLQGRTVTGGRLDALGTLALLDGGPSTTLTVTNTQATFTAAEPHSRFECRFLTDEWRPCSSPVLLGTAPEDEFRFRVRATDAAGNRGDLAEKTVDRRKPVVTITAPGPTVMTEPTEVQYAVDDPDASLICEFEAVPVACADPLPVPAGKHAVLIRAVDDAGNVGSATRSWTVDTTPPTATAEIAGNVLTFGADEPRATFECRIGGGDFVPCASPVTIEGGGSHTIDVRPTDAAGNVGTSVAVPWDGGGTGPAVAITERPPEDTSSDEARLAVLSDAAAVCSLDGDPLPDCSGTLDGLDSGTRTFEAAAGTAVASATWTVDDLEPEATVAPLAGASVDPQPSIGWEVLDANAAEPRCTLDGVPVPCGAGEFQPAADLALGPHTFTLTPVDAAGNVGTTVYRAWDRVVPAVADLKLVPGAARTPSGVGQVPDKPRYTWTVAGGVVTRCSVDGAAETPCKSGFGIDGVGSGSHVLRVTATDSAGAGGVTAELPFTVDLADTRIVSPPPSSTTARSVTVGLGFPDGASRYEYRLDGGAWQTTSNPTVTLSGLAVGAHTVTARAVAPEPGDPVSATFTVVEPPPVVAEPTPTVAPPVVTPAPTPVPTASPKPTATPAPTATPPAKPASTSSLTKSVLRRYAKRSGPAAARVKPFTLAYRATGKGVLQATVKLRVGKRWSTVATGKRTYRRAGRDRIRVATTKAGAALLRKAGASPALRVRSTFTPAA